MLCLRSPVPLEYFDHPGGIDDALMASLRASLAQLEKIARAGLVDEDMPRCVQGIFERQFDEFWSHFREYIEDEVPPSPPSPPPPWLPPSPPAPSVPARSTKTSHSSAPATAKASPPPRGRRRARAGLCRKQGRGVTQEAGRPRLAAPTCCPGHPKASLAFPT